MASSFVYKWTGAQSNSFTIAANWYNATAGIAANVAPGINDEALVVAGGTIMGPGFVSTLGLTGTGAGLLAEGVFNGGHVAIGGTVTLGSGAALASANLIDIGVPGSVAGQFPALLTVGAGAFLNASPAGPGGYDIVVGSDGGTGTLAVSGAGALASAGQRGILAGDNGTGVITVDGGGVLEGGTAYGSGVIESGLVLGHAGGTGVMAVTGAGSAANFSNTVEVGDGGTGKLYVNGGAVFTAGDGIDALNIGDTAGAVSGNGTVSFDASTAYLAGVVEVGNNGPLAGGSSTATLSLTNAASVQAVYGKPGGPASPVWSVVIAGSRGAQGTVSLASKSGLATYAGIAVGMAGTGELDVSSSGIGIFDANSPALGVGMLTGGSGTVNLSDGEIRDFFGSGIVVGGAGTGSMSITGSDSLAGTLLSAGYGYGSGLTLGQSTGGGRCDHGERACLADRHLGRGCRWCPGDGLDHVGRGWAAHHRVRRDDRWSGDRGWRRGAIGRHGAFGDRHGIGGRCAGADSSGRVRHGGAERLVGRSVHRAGEW